MKTRTLTISILLLAIVLVPLAMAVPKDCPLGQDGPRGPREGRGGQWQQGPGGRPGQGPMGMPGGQGNIGRMLLGRFGEELELTQEQRDQIKAIVDNCQAESEEIRAAVQNAMIALHEATAEGTEAEIIAAGKAAGDALTNQALKKAATMNAIKGVLTEEQLTRLDELKAEMKERIQQRREDGQQGGPRRGRRGEGRRQGGGRRGPAPEQY